MSTKKIIGITVVGVLLVAVIAAVIWGTFYYKDRYSGSDYYAQVPADFNVTPELIRSDSGEDMGLGVRFKLTAYNEKGASFDAQFTVFTPDNPYGDINIPIPQPGQFLRINASKTIVVYWAYVKDEGEIPAGAMEKIKAS